MSSAELEEQLLKKKKYGEANYGTDMLCMKSLIYGTNIIMVLILF